MSKKLCVFAVIMCVTAVLLACGPAADVAEKLVYDSTPTPPTDPHAWGTEIEVAYTQAFWVRDGECIEQYSIAGLTPLLEAPQHPQACVIARERFGSSYDLIGCAEVDGPAFVVVAGEGLELALVEVER